MTRFPQVFQDRHMWLFTVGLFIIIKQILYQTTMMKKWNNHCWGGWSASHYSPIQVKCSDEDVLQHIKGGDLGINGERTELRWQEALTFLGKEDKRLAIRGHIIMLKRSEQEETWLEKWWGPDEGWYCGPWWRLLFLLWVRGKHWEGSEQRKDVFWLRIYRILLVVWLTKDCVGQRKKQWSSKEAIAMV